MAFKFPFSTLHELNLDWILEQVKKFSELIPPMETAVDDVQALQTDVEQAVEDANAALEDAASALETAEEAKEIAEQAAQGTIADGAVTTPKIADGAVTFAKIADGAVTGSKIDLATIQTGNLSEGCVTSNKILDGTIVTADIADNAISTAKLGDGVVTAAKLDSAITDKLNALGTYINSTIENTSVPSATVTTIRKLTLQPGTWIVSGYFNYSGGFSERAYGYLLTNGVADAQINGTGEGGGAFALCAVIHVAVATDCTLSAYHQNSNTQNISANILNAVRVSTE